ncbi:aminoglycoside phosphotransferase [Rhodococcus oxybenzonivorans]|uniref:Aminoglycoside phosphotransferase n=1 Tax=Rhodococcus oxybenzonivorans TaxID=1990687 RepID=A0A2S2BR94_9NOCA|nr:phosphotransferase [Rhodococcus oxybenzonivorans]AWK71121.1 aminoglycoside phosphotransferase [Rhodococcus oxybenzonivorans]
MTIAVPDTLEEALSPQWLTAALEPRYAGIEVREVIPGPVVDRVSTNARFTIVCERDTPDGLSSSLCVKGYFNDQGREARSVGEREACFYRDLAAGSGVRTLRGVYADFDPATHHGVVITEDVVAEGGVFLDADSHFTPDQAAESLSQFARLHATTWGRAQWAETTWLKPKLDGALRAWGADTITARIDENLNGPNGLRVPAEVRDARRLTEAYSALVGTLQSEHASSDWCVIHGDAHVGNLFLDPMGAPSLVDWQLVQRGMWYLDVGTHIATALTVDDRRRSEKDLLWHYLDCLASHGIALPSRDAAWRALSRGIVRGFFLWGITAKVAPHLIEILLHRLGTAVADHDAL